MSSTKREVNEAKNPMDDNPCGICRANGLPICKGHGGGGGGDSDSSSPTSDSVADTATDSTALPLDKTLVLSPLWSNVGGSAEDAIFEFKNQEDALVSIKLDMGRGRITISGHENMSEDQKKSLAEFQQAIKSEFEQFKKELADAGVSPKTIEAMQANHSKDGLTITIPSAKYYDMFVSRLIEKNILATQPVSTHQLSASEQSVQSMQQAVAPEEQTMDRPTTSTPFDISGPKPT